MQMFQIYLNNHLQISLFYHEHADGEYRVVGFEVEPRSVRWDSLKVDNGACSPKAGVLRELPPQELVRDGPFAFASTARSNRTSSSPVSAENTVLWTYSVSWNESPVKWASRWDTYLAMRDVQIHWFSIINSIVVVLCLSGNCKILQLAGGDILGDPKVPV